MNYKHFKIVADLNDLKEQYRQLCKMYHPDLGGDTATMQEVNNEYEKRLKSGFFNAEMQDKKSSVEIEKGLRDVIQKVAVFKKASIEICGKWLWITGETWRYKKLLKEYGFLWSRNKTAWYWRQEQYKGKWRGSSTLDQIRSKYGSSQIRNKECNELT